MPIPRLPEANHPLIQSLSQYSDRELLTLFQQNSEQGKYFSAIYCRYSPMLYTLIASSLPSSHQADSLFALTWQQIFASLGELVFGDDDSVSASLTNLDNRRQGTDDAQLESLQNWLIYTTAVHIHQAERLLDKATQENSETAHLPLQCYLAQAVEQLPPLLRFIVVMIEKFGWSQARVTAYLQADGEMLSRADVKELLEQGYQLLEAALPEDIREIYLGTPEAVLLSEPG